MILSVEQGGDGADSGPVVFITCDTCGTARPVYSLAGMIPELLAPAARVFVERFEPEHLPGRYTCDICRSTPKDAP